MKWRKFVPIFIVVALLVLLISSISVGASGNTDSYYVQIPQSAVTQARSLNLNPEIALDYGSYQWLVLNESDFNKLADSTVEFSHAPDAGKLQVTRYRFDPVAEGEPALSSDMLMKTGDAGLRFVQFYGPTNDTWIGGLEAAGLEVLQYYPSHTYLVWGTASQVAAVEAGRNVRWTGAFHPGYKIHTDLDFRVGTVTNVDVFFYNSGNVEGTVADLEALGANVVTYFPAQPDKAFYSAIIQVDASAFGSIAQLNNVVWLGYSSPEPILDDEMASQINAGNFVGGVPFTGYFAHLADLGYDGTGVTWAVIDTGIDYAHPDLNTRIVAGRQYPGACAGGGPGDDCSNGGHGTHVAGIIGGDGTFGSTDGDGFLYGVGVAPGANFFASNSLSAGAWPPAGGWQEHSEHAVQGGAIGGNNSWTTGEGTNHGYQASERTHDIMVLDGDFTTAAVAEPFIEVFSAGNSGATGLTAPKEGKNLIVTAASNNFRAGSIEAIAGFSSRGPAVDGRWVPTIAAPGATIASTMRTGGGLQCATPIGGTSNHYSFCSGTSMAAPHTSGSITLMTEWWRDGNGGVNPSPAMAKALVVASADDMGTPDIPNINEGWGRINVTNIMSPSVPIEYWDLPTDFGNSGESWTVSVGVVDPSQPLKVTLAWADAPGAVGANPALVNDLDLTVDNGGNTYLGNVFTGGWSTIGGSRDTINNLENVYVETPGGAATITVDAFNVSGDAILYNGDTTDQSFALICQNCALEPNFTVTATPNPLTVCAPNDGVYTVDIGSILGFGASVDLSASGNPAGTTASFGADPVTPPDTTTLTIGNTGSATAGNYMIDVVGMSVTATQTATVGFNLFDAAPGAPMLTAPPNGASGVSSTPTFMWTAAAQADTYDIEIATDAGFTMIVDAATVPGTSYTPGSPLPAGTTLFWRVRANNACGSGGFSATFNFSTLTCSVVNLAIPDDDPNGITTDLVLTDPGNVLDLDVEIDVTHTWVGDLQFDLTHVDTGTTVTFYDRPGVPASTFGCSGDDIDAILDDEAGSNVEDECGAGVPSIAGSFIPNNALSAFDGETVAGTWRLTASDHAGGDTGTVVEWCVTATGDGPTPTPIPSPTPTSPPTGVELSEFSSDTNMAWVLWLLPVVAGLGLYGYIRLGRED